MLNQLRIFQRVYDTMNMTFLGIPKIEVIGSQAQMQKYSYFDLSEDVEIEDWKQVELKKLE